MKSLLFASALIAVASAGLVQPGGSGPAIIISEPVDISDYQPINVGPAIHKTYDPINVGPADVESYEPINVEPVVVDSFEPIQVEPVIVADPEQIEVEPVIVANPEPIQVGPAIIDNEASNVKAPIVQIVLNINSLPQAIEIPLPSPINPEPVIVVDEAENPIDSIQVIDVNPTPVEVVDVQPAEIGVPVLPNPAITLPEELN